MVLAQIISVGGCEAKILLLACQGLEVVFSSSFFRVYCHVLLGVLLGWVTIYAAMLAALALDTRLETWC